MKIRLRLEGLGRQISLQVIKSVGSSYDAERRTNGILWLKSRELAHHALKAGNVEISVRFHPVIFI